MFSNSSVYGPSSSPKRIPIGAIVGAVVGGVFFIVVITIIMFFVRKPHSAKVEKNPPDFSDAAPAQGQAQGQEKDHDQVMECPEKNSPVELVAQVFPAPPHELPC